MTKHDLLGSTVVFEPPTEGATAPTEASKRPEQSPRYPAPKNERSPSSVAKKGRPQAPRAPPASGAYSVASFCESFGLSAAMLYKLWARGEGPDFFKAGTRTLISYAAAERWCRARERAAKAHAI